VIELAHVRDDATLPLAQTGVELLVELRGDEHADAPGAAIGTYLVPKALDHLGIGTTMIIAAVITLIGAVVSLAWAPETRGLTLGETAALPDVTTSTVRSGRFGSPEMPST
jgi:hypothetical protein